MDTLKERATVLRERDRMTFAAIADLFNSEGLRTANGAEYKGMTIHRLVDGAAPVGGHTWTGKRKRKVTKKVGPGRGCRPGENRGGGPATGAGETRAITALLTHRDPQAGITHGMTSADGLLRCDKCACKADCADFRAGERCGIEAAYIPERRKALLSVGHLDAAIDGPSLDALISTEIRIGRGLRYLAAAGEFLPGADAGYVEYQPCLKTLTSLQSLREKQLQALSLTPSQRRDLGQAQAQAAGGELLDAFRELRRRESAVEGEFEEVGGDGDSD